MKHSRSPVIIDAKEFGAKLKEIRIKNGVKQAELADAIGIARNSISYYETGRCWPSLDLIIQICFYFKISLDYLVGMSKLQKDSETLQFNDTERIWIKELLETEKVEHLKFAKFEHIAALGSSNNKESAMHENNADNHRIYANKMDALIRKVVQHESKEGCL